MSKSKERSKRLREALPTGIRNTGVLLLSNDGGDGDERAEAGQGDG